MYVNVALCFTKLFTHSRIRTNKSNLYNFQLSLPLFCSLFLGIKVKVAPELQTGLLFI